MGWTHTRSCDWPFQMLSDHESICIAVHHGPNCQERSFAGGEEGLVPRAPAVEGECRRAAQRRPPPAHPPALTRYIPTSSGKWFFSAYPEQIPQMKVLFLVGGEGGVGAGLWGPGSQHSFALSGKKISRHRWTVSWGDWTLCPTVRGSS